MGQLAVNTGKLLGCPLLVLDDTFHVKGYFLPFTSAGVQLGSPICVDTDGHLENIHPQTWELVEQILSKQM